MASPEQAATTPLTDHSPGSAASINSGKPGLYPVWAIKFITTLGFLAAAVAMMSSMVLLGLATHHLNPAFWAPIQTAIQSRIAWMTLTAPIALAIAAALIAVITVLLYSNALALNRIDSARQRAQEELLLRSEQWELTFDCMSEGLSYHDVDYNIIGANKAFRRLVPGCAIEDTKCYRLVHGTDSPPAECPMRKTLESGQTEESELFEPRLNKHLLVRTDPVRDASGKIFRVVHVVEDITERKRAELETQRLATIVESSDDAIIGKDLDGVIQSWNAGAERMYGYTEEEAKGRNIAFLFPPEHQQEHAEILASIRAGNVVRSMDTVRLTKSGMYLNVSVTVSPIRDNRGNIVGGSTIARDITDQKLAQAALEERTAEAQRARRDIEVKAAQINELNAQLEARVRQRTLELEVANKELEAFSYSVSHDLRAPLRSLDGFSHILLDEYRDKLDEEGQDFLRRLRGASQQMGRLIDALLQLSRVSRSEMNKIPVDLSALAAQIMEDMRKTSPERKVDVSIAPSMVTMGDPHLLSVVLQNLLGNAWKFTGKTKQAHIECGAIHDQGVATFFVRDNGAGFDMTYSNKLFGAFQRLHAVNDFEGSGIGLATVQRIVRRHGGRVWAQGEPGYGATFYFTLE